MSAPKRTPQHTRKTVYLRPRKSPDPPTSFRSDVLRYVGAKRAFKELTDNGLQGPNEDMFWRHLWGLASVAKAEKEAKTERSKRRAGPWYSLPGLPLHKMRRLPGQLRDWADTIETVGKAIQSNDAYGMTAGALPLFLLAAIPNQKYEVSIGSEVFQEVGTANPSVAADLARSLLQRLKRTDLPKVEDLPALLRLYADYIEAISKLTAHYAPRGSTLLKRTPLQFVELIRTVTGKAHWNEIATLLTAAYHANGCGSVEVFSKALQTQYRRFKK